MNKTTRYRIALALLAATVAVVGDAPPLSAAGAGSECTSLSIADNEPFLKMIIIRTTSSKGLKQLRGMHLDIVNVRPDPDRPPGGELLSGGYVVEAVVTKGELAKLKAMGFEISEVPEKN
jgi:hypothetical protein